MKRLGEDAATIDNALIAMAVEGATALARNGKTLRDAVSFYLSHLIRQSVSVPASDFAGRVRGEFDRRREAGESSVRHHTSMLETLKKFEERFADRQSLTASEITTWLATKARDQTRNRHLGYLHNAFGLAVTKFKILAANPLEKVDFFHDPARKGRRVEILTPQEMTRFLSVLDPDRLPFFAISAFTGLRREEVSRLDWSEVKLGRSLIDLPFSKSKNGKRKLEEIPKNLRAILSRFARAEGSIMPRKKLALAMTNAA